MKTVTAVIIQKNLELVYLLLKANYTLSFLCQQMRKSCQTKVIRNLGHARLSPSPFLMKARDLNPPMAEDYLIAGRQP